jgi:hypothetical protein
MRTRFAIVFIVLLGLQALLIRLGSGLFIGRRPVLIIYYPFFALFMPHMSHHNEGDLPRIVLWGASVGAFVYSTILAGLAALFFWSQQQPRDPHA